MAALKPTVPGRPRRLLLACLGGLVLASSCNLPKPPIPTKLLLTQGGPDSRAAYRLPGAPAAVGIAAADPDPLSAQMRKPGRDVMRAIAGMAVAFLVAGCSSSPSPPTWGDRVPTASPGAFANQVVTQGPDSITLLPISPSGASLGVSYGYVMPHCGINSPIDVDGSFWDAVGIAQDSVEFDGQPGTFRLISANSAEFTSDSGEFPGSPGPVLNLVRHQGSKQFRFCQ